MEAIQALGLHDEVAGLLPPAIHAPQASEVPFGRVVSEGLQGLNEQLKTSEADLQRLAVGEAPNLHEVMTRLEETRIAFQLMLQVRNRMLEAYQDVMKMQI
jgi:flagellar hook-basal body complex protein FliE